MVFWLPGHWVTLALKNVLRQKNLTFSGSSENILTHLGFSWEVRLWEALGLIVTGECLEKKSRWNGSELPYTLHILEVSKLVLFLSFQMSVNGNRSMEKRKTLLLELSGCFPSGFPNSSPACTLTSFLQQSTGAVKCYCGDWGIILHLLCIPLNSCKWQHKLWSSREFERLRHTFLHWSSVN